MIRHLERFYRQISVVLPIRSREPATVTSRAIPGAALGLHRAGEQSAVHGAGGAGPGRYREVPGPVLTTLYDAQNQLLFRALHHNLFSTPELEAEALARLSDADLNALARELLVQQGCKLRVGETRSEQAGRHCRAFREGGSQALTVAHTMTRRACAQMARATAAAALSADAPKRQCALSGQVVDLRLFLISLLRTGQAAAWCEQAAAFEELEQQQPVELLVGGPGVEPRSVQARIRGSQFVFSPDREELNEHAIPPPDRALAELLGEGPGQSPGGRVGACLDAVKGFMSELHKACAGVLPDAAQSVPGSSTPAAPLTRPPAQGVESLIDVDLLECEVHTLEAACRQLKRDWAPDGTWPADPGVQTQAAARLALIAYLIGEAPVLSCAKDSGLTRQLDAEAQFLATVACHHDGQLPKLEPAAIQTSVRRVEVGHVPLTPFRVEFADDPGNPPWAAHLIKQPPKLQHTRVQTAQGMVLYEGLYHDTFNAGRVSGPILSRWPAGELVKHIELCLVGEVNSPASWETVNMACARIRQDPEIAAQFARQLTNLLCEQAAMEMARNTVTASLYVDDGRRRTIARALVGETVDAHLFNVCLLAPGTVRLFREPRGGRFLDSGQ